MMWWNGGTGWAGWVVMSVTMIAFWALVVVAVLAIFRGDRATQQRVGPAHHDPEQILDERFARGEIDVEEYHDRQEALRSPRGRPEQKQPVQPRAVPPETPDPHGRWGSTPSGPPGSCPEAVASRWPDERD